MAYSSFRSFLDALDKAGDLKRVVVPVDTDLLIAEWADREMKSPGGGKALLFEQAIVDGKKSEFPVAINTMGSRRRMALALQVTDVEDVAREIQLILKAKPPTDLREGWNLLETGNSSPTCATKIRARCAMPGSCASHRKWRQLFPARSPDPQMLAQDGGRFVTLANVHTREPETAVRNVGLYRMQVYADTRPGCTGSFTRSARDTGSDITNAGSACRSRSRWVAIPYILSLQLHRFRTAWTSFCSLVFCEENQSSLFAAQRSILKYQRTLTLFWKATSTWELRRRDRSAITQVITLPSRIIPCSI